MLEIIFNGRSFGEQDFFYQENPIEISLTLELANIEIGIFEDHFDPQNENLINVIIKQETPDDLLRYFHKESGEEIPYGNFRCINFIKYDSLRTPKEELTFYRGRGVGKFLKYLVEKFFEGKGEEVEGEKEEVLNIKNYINKESVDQILDYINRKLNKLKGFKEFGIVVSIEEEIKNLIYELLTIKDSKGLDIQKIGYGVQFHLLITLTLLEKIMGLIENKHRQKCKFSQNENSGKKKYISVVLGLDEPEIHLHPYMQRTLIKYIKNILTNENEEFSSLLKELFDVDAIIGQAIVVTHSPHILLNDYKQMIRFFPSKKSSMQVRSGVDINLDAQKEKHLLMNLPYVKEAFFSKCVIIVEGETEFGALPIWGEKVIGDLDEHGISVIKAGGKGSIKPLVELLNSFNIKTVSIRDRDEGTNLDGYDFVTDGKDFEEDLVNELFSKSQKEILFDILAELGKFDPHSKPNILEKDLIEKQKTIKTLRDNKSVITGRIIGKIVNKDLIPKKFKKALERAKEYATES